jgi:hypothetical protein
MTARRLALLGALALALTGACGTRTPPRGLAPVDTSTTTGGGGGGGGGGAVDPACKAACTTGTCEGSVCVVRPDAPAAPVICPDGIACRIDCRAAGSCQGDLVCGDGGCEVVCTGQGACGGGITCGTGDCKVRCGDDASTVGACLGIIDCRPASACDIRCLGDRSCQHAVFCGSGPCAVRCGGPGATGNCMRGVDCPASCGCDLVCEAGSCNGYACPRDCRASAFRGCRTDTAACDTCVP